MKSKIYEILEQCSESYAEKLSSGTCYWNCILKPYHSGPHDFFRPENIKPAASKKYDDLGVGIENPKFNYYRAAGDTICSTCGEAYYEHPVIRGKERRTIGIELYVLCNTDRVKL
jgi:hypothetical protein